MSTHSNCRVVRLKHEDHPIAGHGLSKGQYLPRYLLMLGYFYYPAGLHDFLAGADDLAQLEKYAKRKAREQGDSWWQIVERDTLAPVSRGNTD